MNYKICPTCVCLIEDYKSSSHNNLYGDRVDVYFDNHPNCSIRNVIPLKNTSLNLFNVIDLGLPYKESMLQYWDCFYFDNGKLQWISDSPQVISMYTDLANKLQQAYDMRINDLVVGKVISDILIEPEPLDPMIFHKNLFKRKIKPI